MRDIHTFVSNIPHDILLSPPPTVINRVKIKVKNRVKSMTQSIRNKNIINKDKISNDCFLFKLFLFFIFFYLCQGSQSTESKLLKKENTNLKELMNCKVCRQRPSKSLFLPCGDLYACEECANQLSHCPNCRSRILGTVTTFFA